MKATKRWNLRLEPCLPSSRAPWLDPWTKRTPKEVSENDSALLSIFCLCPQQHKGDPTPTIKSIVFNGQTNVLIPFPLTRLFLPESSGNRTEKTETMNRIENRQAILWSRGNMQSIEHDDLDYSDRHSIGLWPCTVHWAVGAGGAGPRKWWLCTNQWAFQPLQKKAPCKTELQEPSNLRWQRLKWAIKCPWDSRQSSQISHFGLRRGDIAASIIFPHVPSLTEQLHIRTKRCQFDVPRWNSGKLMKPGPILSFLKRLSLRPIFQAHNWGQSIFIHGLWPIIVMLPGNIFAANMRLHATLFDILNLLSSPHRSTLHTKEIFFSLQIQLHCSE